jgi:uncharacterized tellurite resistance protein B-like protein
MNDETVDQHFEGASLVIETGGETEIYDSQFLIAALLVYVAKGNGAISGNESAKMLQLVGDHFRLQSSESLALISRAMSNLAENPDLGSLLKQLSTGLGEEQKEDVAIMLMKVIAADGNTDGDEMEAMTAAGEIIDISPEAMHRAFDRYFAETRIDEG